MADSTSDGPLPTDETGPQPEGEPKPPDGRLARLEAWARRADDAVGRAVRWLAGTLSLSLSRVTVALAAAITVVSAIHLSVVSRGSPETELAVLQSGNGSLVLTGLASVMPWVADGLLLVTPLALVVVTRSWWAGAAGGLLVAGAVWYVAHTGLYLLVAFAYLSLGAMIWWYRQHPPATPTEKRGDRASAAPSRQPNPKWLDGLLERRRDWQALTRLGVVALVAGLLIGAFGNGAMWLPPERIQLSDRSVFTGYELGTSGERTRVLTEHERRVITFPNDAGLDIVGARVCTLRDQGGSGWYDSFKRMLGVSPPDALSGRGRPRYERCPT